MDSSVLKGYIPKEIYTKDYRDIYLQNYHAVYVKGTAQQVRQVRNRVNIYTIINFRRLSWCR